MVTREQESDSVKLCDVCKKPVPTQKWYWSTSKFVYTFNICNTCIDLCQKAYPIDPYRATYAEAEYDLLLKKLS